MGVEINIIYKGDLECEAIHVPSNTKLTTQAPLDNGGKGESFSPTDLTATALGTCLMTIMGIVAKNNGIDIKGSKVHVVKEMVMSPARRIGTLKITVRMPAHLSDKDRTKLEEAAKHCPVKLSLHPEVNIPIQFIYE